MAAGAVGMNFAPRFYDCFIYDNIPPPESSYFCPRKVEVLYKVQEGSSTRHNPFIPLYTILTEMVLLS